MKYQWRACLAVSLLCGMLGPARALSFHWGTDTFYALDAADLDTEQRAKLQAVLCKVGTREVDVVVIVGHASGDETDAQALSLRRAQAVARWFESHAAWKTQVDAKGATQPVANNQEAAGRSKNRRVEIDPIVPKPFDGKPSATDCTPAWKKTLLASAQTAPLVARLMVVAGEIPADTPFRTALIAERLDIFDALVASSGIHLSVSQHAEIAMLALNRGLIQYFLNWIKQDGARLIPQKGDVFLRQACNSGANATDKVRAIDALVHSGAKVASADAMGCLVGYSNKPVEVLDALVRAGGMPFVTPDMVVASGKNPHILHRLLALGKDPNVRDAEGATLFHTMKLATTGDVQRLLDWGLDINALLSQPHRASTTPMFAALPYASPEVLQFMQQRGARIEGEEPINQAYRNEAAQRWLVDNGVPVNGNELVTLAKFSPRTMDVFRALRKRGTDFGAKNPAGVSALAVAINNYDVGLVDLLVGAGADVGPQMMWPNKSAGSAMEMAQNLTAVPSRECFGPCSESLPAPERSADLEARRGAIISILQNAPARP